MSKIKLSEMTEPTGYGFCKITRQVCLYNRYDVVDCMLHPSYCKHIEDQREFGTKPDQATPTDDPKTVEPAPVFDSTALYPQNPLFKEREVYDEGQDGHPHAMATP